MGAGGAPGDVYASVRVLRAGSWSSLTIDGEALAAMTGKPWDRVRFRPRARLSPKLHAELLAAMHAIQSRPRRRGARALVDFLAGVGDEVVETDARQTTPRGLPSRAAERFACFREDTSGCVPLSELANETGSAGSRRCGPSSAASGCPARLPAAGPVGLAQKSLREGMPPAHVAAELGFVDQSHFTRHFKQLVGVTPAKYARGIIPTPTVPKPAH